MAYRNVYRRGYQGRQTTGRVAKPNARPGPCRSCGEEIPAYAGQLWREESGAWSVVHVPQEWAGSPTSGQYTGGCPAETDRMNAEGRFGGPRGARPERDRIASAAAMRAAMAPPSRSIYTLSSGARVSGSRGRCGDAPCCGCCD